MAIKFHKASSDCGDWCDFRSLKGEMKSPSVLYVHVDFSSPTVRAEGVPIYAVALRTSILDTNSQSTFDVGIDDAVEDYLAVSATTDDLVVAK